MQLTLKNVCSRFFRCNILKDLKLLVHIQVIFRLSANEGSIKSEKLSDGIWKSIALQTSWLVGRGLDAVTDMKFAFNSVVI